MNFLKKIQFLGIDLYSLLFITIGTFIFVLGINLFLTPAELIPIGFTGISYEISYILHKLFNINVQYNIVYFILNIPIIIFGFKKIGNKFITKTLFSIILFTVFAQIIPSNIEPFAIESSGDVLISGLIAAILMGTGVGLTLKVGGSSGGGDIIAVYISLFKGKSFGLYNFLINVFVILIAFLITFDIKIVAITLIYLYVYNNIVDIVHNSQEKRTLIVFTTKEAAVKEIIYANFHRGITVIDSEGGYSKVPNKTLLISISYGELHQIIRYIKEADDKAFINVFKTDMIVGNFDNPYQKML